MKIRTMAAGALVAVLCLLASLGGGFGLGLGGGSGNGPGDGAAKVNNAAKQEKDDTTLIVRIEGNKLLVGGKEWSADAIARHAEERHAAVEVIRATDATVGANNELLDALHAKQIHPRLREGTP
ncbi:MAG: hypothetical protein U1D30_17655 [Planctomycetota bacterium]